MLFAEMGSFPADEISKILAENNKKANELENKYTMCNNSQKVAGTILAFDPRSVVMVVLNNVHCR